MLISAFILRIRTHELTEPSQVETLSVVIWLKQHLHLRLTTRNLIQIPEDPSILLDPDQAPRLRCRARSRLPRIIHIDETVGDIVDVELDWTARVAEGRSGREVEVEPAVGGAGVDGDMVEDDFGADGLEGVGCVVPEGLSCLVSCCEEGDMIGDSRSGR